MRRILAIFLLVLGLCAGRATAQAADAAASKSATDRLDALLGGLRGLPAAAWDARSEAMRAGQAQAMTLAQAAADLAVGRRKEAEQRDAAAKAIDADVERLGQLRALAATLKFRDAGKGGEAGQLDRMLQELSQLTAAAWDARAKASCDAAAGERDAAKTLRAAADQADADAAAKRAEAAAIAQELEQVGKLRALLAGMREIAPPPVSKPEAAKPEAAKPETVPTPAMPAKSEPAATEPAKAAPAKADAPKADEHLVTYADDVFPIFEESCITCHERGETSGGLDLSSHAMALQGGGSGRTIRPGNPDASRLFLLVSHKEKPGMPLDEPPLANAKIETIRLWIAQGAPKDRAEAERLAGDRAVAKAKGDAAAASTARARADVASVVPDAGLLARKRLAARSPAVRAVAAAPAAALLAMSGIGQVLLLSADDLRELGALEFPFGQVERLAFSADGRRLLAAGGQPGRKGGVVLYDLATASVLHTFGEQRDVVLAAALSPDGTLVAVGGTRKKVEVFEVEGGALAWSAPHDDWVTDVCFSADGTMLASGDRAGRVFVREALLGRELQTLTVAEGAVAALAFSPDSTLLATGGVDRTVRAFQTGDGSQAFSQKVHAEAVTALCWCDDGHFLSAGADGRVLHWRKNGGRERDLPGLGDWLYGLCASADGKRCFVGDWTGRLRVVDLGTRKVAAEIAPFVAVQ